MVDVHRVLWGVRQVAASPSITGILGQTAEVMSERKNRNVLTCCSTSSCCESGETGSSFHTPVLVGGAGHVQLRSHQWEGQIKVMQVEGQGFPGSSTCIGAPPSLAFELQCDWTLTGFHDPQSILLAQVNETPPTHLR